MEELSQIMKTLDLSASHDDNPSPEYTNVFTNPSRLPINQIHLEKKYIELKRDATLNKFKSCDSEWQCFNTSAKTVPALSQVWVIAQPFHSFFPYNFTLKPEDNCLFPEKNYLFLCSLRYLLNCSYHQFWCLVLFEPSIPRILHSFLLHSIPLHRVKDMSQTATDIYLAVFSTFRRVFQRLISFQETEIEYMSDNIGLNYLLDKKILNLPIVVTLIMLYSETNLDFINDLTSLYFMEKSKFTNREIEEIMQQTIMTLEMVGGNVCGFESDSVIVPIALDPKPAVFQINWVYLTVDYLLNTVTSVSMILKFYKPSLHVALSKQLPYRLSYTYEKVFHQIYKYINQHKGLEENAKLFNLIYEEIAMARSQFIDVYNIFVNYCLDKVLEFSGNSIRQEEYIELYLKLMTTALEDEYFICDYHERYDVGLQNEMFSSCAEIDETRTGYVLKCITCLKRHNKLWKTLKTELKILNKAENKYANNRRVKVDSGFDDTPPGPSNYIQETYKPTPTEAEIEDLIAKVIEMFPHLGDGFALKCLEHYSYQVDDVISAILEENLAPFLIEVPFDSIRIPEEPVSPIPVLAYKRHKPDYDDVLKLLNDKNDLKDIKTFIMDGLQYTNAYDLYDDEYDDRADEATVSVRDHGSEDILKYNPNYEDAVSDTSYSENEYDDAGQVVQESTSKVNGKANFCEDPAIIRARQEARRRNGRPVAQKQDVVGKAMGQGQQKNVLDSRAKKNVNKASRGNHHRKSRAQWKRSRGVIPS